jgi:hypothetical protein
MRSRFFIFVFLPFSVLCIVAFWIRGVILLDPDFGWHLRMGEIIQKTGIPKTDPFSYTMPSYPFVDHEWLTNVVIAKLYPLVGTKGLAVGFSFLATLAILIQLPFPIKKWSFVPFALVAGSLLSFVGVRTQAIAWVFFSILLFIVLHKKTQKWRFMLPPLFILWANLHGGFGIGVVTLFVVTLVHIWEQRKILFGEIIVLILCFAATVINPYGIHLWWELWMQISDTSLRWNISEWRPAIFTLNFTLWTFVSLSVLLMLRYRKKFYLSQLALYSIMLIAGLSSIRHMPFWLLLALPMATSAMTWFSEEAKSYKGGVVRLNKAYAILAIGVVLVVFVESVVNLDGAKSLQEHSFYPKEAVEFLAVYKSCGQLFSTYGWGGYLIWKLPEKKVFIDGRMPSWRWKSAPSTESNYAFEEYNKFLAGKIPAKDIFTKYNIDTFLLPIEKKKNAPPFLKKLQETLERLFNRQDDGYGKFIKQLKDSGMEEVYKDNTAVIYRQKYSIQCVKPIQ